MTIGQTIREIRKAYGITQKQLADACGIDDATIRKYESGKLNPKPSTIEKIAKGLDVDVNVLLGSNVDCSKTMINLFRAFNSYAGVLKDGEQIQKEVDEGTFEKDLVYVAFPAINALMFSWFMEYERYLEALKKAECLDDDELKKKYIDEVERRFQLWMFKYPETEPAQEMLKYNIVNDEISDFIGTHPLNDPDHPVSAEYRKKVEKQLKEIANKLNDIQLWGPKTRLDE